MSRLAAAGADLMFGVPGGGPNIDMIEKGAGAGIRFVLTHGETAACISAGVYGKLTGSPGLAAVTRGPGVTSAANGMAQATLDRFPLVLLSDAVPAAERHRFVHQRLDQNALMAPVTKWTGTLGYENPAEVVERAARLAVEAPAGSVHLDFDLTSPGDLPPEPPPPARLGPGGARRGPARWSTRPADRCSWWGPGPSPTPARCVRPGREPRYPGPGHLPGEGAHPGHLAQLRGPVHQRLVGAAAGRSGRPDRGGGTGSGGAPGASLAVHHPGAGSSTTAPLTDSYYPVAVEVNGPVDAVAARSAGPRSRPPGPRRRDPTTTAGS